MAPDVLLIALRDTDARVRLTAASSLGRLGSQARRALPALMEALWDTAVQPREDGAGQDILLVGDEAANALRVIGVGPSQLPLVAKAIADPDPLVRRRGANALQGMHPLTNGAAHVAAEALTRESVRDVRLELMEVLSGARESVQFVTALLEKLQDDADAEVRAAAKRALSRLTTGR